MKVIYCSCSPNQCRTDQPSSLKSSSAKVPKVLGRETLKRCLKLLNESNQHEETCRSYLQDCLTCFAYLQLRFRTYQRNGHKLFNFLYALLLPSRTNTTQTSYTVS